MSSRAAVTGWLVAVWVCLLVGLSSQPLHAGPLPRLAVSLPSGTPVGDIIRTINASGMRDAVIILPLVTVRVGGAGPAIEAGLPLQLPGEIAAGPDLYLHLVVQIGDVPGAGRDREALVEGRVSEIVDAMTLDALPLKGLIVQAPGGGPSPELLQFTLATLIVKARGARPGLHVSLMLPDDVLERPGELKKRMVAYADSVALGGRALAGTRDQEFADLIAGRPVILRVAGAAGTTSSDAARAFIDSLVTAGTPATAIVWVDAATTAALREVCASYQFLARALGAGFEMTAPERAPAAVLLDGQPAKPAVAFVGSGTADVAVLLRAGGSRGAPRTLSVAAAAGEAVQVTCYDAFDGRRLPGQGEGRPAPGCTADAEYAFVHVRRGGGESRLFEAVTVAGRADLRVEEIIARWQTAREAERRVLDNYFVPCFLTLHIEVTSFGLGFDVSLELQRFVDRSGTNDWVQTGFFVNGVRFRKGQEFPLPLLEPEKVMTQPLELAMDEKYVYRLLGTDTVNGASSYVIAIEPAVPTALLYAGRVWIDGLTFRQVRMQLEQRSGQHNISTHVETQDFRTVRDAQGREFTVFQRIFVDESLNVAGRPVTLEKIYRFGDYAVNAADFQERLEAARASDSPMFRDTDEGLRTLRRQGSERVVESAPGKRIRSFIGGAVYDGSYSFPVPLAGVSWVDFDFRGKGSQLSAVFAGLFLAGNLSKQRGPRLRTSLEFALSALSTTDRVFVGDVELKGQQFRSFEQSAGGVISWQASAAWTLTTSGHAAVMAYRRTADTDSTFTIPRTGLILRAWGEVKYAKQTLDASVLVEPSVRVAGFGDFGEAGALETPRRSYVKYQAEVNKRVYAGKLTRGGVTASYYGGAGLDRLARYRTTFLMKPRIVGVPAGVESFDAIAIAGAYYGFNVLDLAKLQGSYNHAWARNLGESRRFRQFDGLNLDIGAGGPWGTYVQGSVGFTLRGSLARYDSRLSAIVLIYKPVRR